MMNSITILLATFNGAPYLSEQLDSLLAQTYTDWNLLIHDDNSDDETVEIIKKYIEHYPEKIKLIDDKTSYNSASANFASLLKHVTSEYVMFCDQDDIWTPSKIALTLEKMHSLEADFPDLPLLVHTDLKVVDKELNMIADSYWEYQHLHPSFDQLNALLIQNVITGCTVMINRQLRTKALPIPDDVIMHDWWLGLVASAFGKIGYLETATVLYRQHSSNDTGAKPYGVQVIIEKARSLSDIKLYKYISQANALLERYADDLDPDQENLIHSFIKIQEEPWLKSKYVLWKYRILKQGILRNVGLFLCR